MENVHKRNPASSKKLDYVCVCVLANSKPLGATNGAFMSKKYIQGHSRQHICCVQGHSCNLLANTHHETAYPIVPEAWLRLKRCVPAPNPHLPSTHNHSLSPHSFPSELFLARVLRCELVAGNGKHESGPAGRTLQCGREKRNKMTK